MSLVSKILCGIALLSILACGGGGGVSNPLRELVQRQASAINSENLQAFGNTLSTDYYNDCLTKGDELAQAQELFETGTVKITILEWLSSAQVGDEGVISVRFRLQYNGSLGNIDTTDVETWYILNEGGTWREIGDQNCD